MGPLEIKESLEGCSFALRVAPRSQRNEAVGIENGVLKLRIQAPPAEGAANEAVIAFLAGLVKRPKSSIKVFRGLKSRNKAVRIQGIKALELKKLFENNMSKGENHG